MRRILIGFDGSERGDDALALGQALAQLAGPEAEVVVATVYPVAPAARAGGEPQEARLRDDAEALLLRARSAWPELPAHAFQPICASSPAAGLHRLALDARADTIVVGASHRGAAGRIVPGSATEQTLHGSPCAVAVAPPGYAEAPRMLRRIGVAYDGSPEARFALETVAELARREGAVVVVVAVADLTQPFSLAFGYPSYVVDLQGLADEQLQEARAALGEGADADFERREGDPVHELIEASHRVDLLALGSRGHGPVRRLLLGSVSTHVVRGAGCPLLLLPRSAAPAAEAAESSAVADVGAGA